VRVFEGFAAPLGYRAVEKVMPDGKCHGVFTYALLQGLGGAARSPVTSDSLRDYLFNAMKEFMSDEQRGAGINAKEPSFSQVGQITFATRPRPTFPVTLQFAQEHVGRRVFVATGRSDPPVDETVLETTEWTAHVEARFWGVFIEGTDISKGIEVTGGGANGAIPVP
jgi:hypothetical protein